ncbi:MAG: hypothetical protein Q8L37_01975 [Candidatus Gottesmanbacteria bacterium]|nr:hypothetical protein [Candidatus Gottesmanbacteria bacterium]
MILNKTILNPEDDLLTLSILLRLVWRDFGGTFAPWNFRDSGEVGNDCVGSAVESNSTGTFDCAVGVVN